ncbi:MULTISPECIES: hypothetical protein [Streptomyces]|uniref:Uncharacterized protein n=1 Tax=Streptomyces clavifer TaxID=68188 RepID=A0ABS4V1W7_9ACTN|nr:MULTISPECIES: hypothetical protein [Streptomyces]MBP2357912.1 hypothetical protein [Streptomyces clavifer]MDX2742416.1 hypothetical protein [Streptomyces sp. NRRL_B-2557]MDX3063509.1 hypothetical protein [Streptomyces sp. ND04-05B]RPK84287.1 hypothetical protein EES45_04855 [Streptomyces sp. ADI97-07]GHA87180.1 hypothetical protein GCM10010392_11770 [Streptomyces clavifer]
MISWIRGAFPHHEVNVVFARGTSAGTLTQGLRDRQREPLASGEADGWAWAVHEMLNGEIEDFDDVDYNALCPDGTEIIVFVTQPCSPKGFPPAFAYHRDGHLVLWFSFEDVRTRVGANPDHLSPELLAAGIIGPDTECGLADEFGHDCFDHFYDDHERLVKVIADYFALPSPPLTAEVASK